MKNEKIINTHMKCYLIGAMEKTGSKDEGVGWRSKIKPELEKRINKDGNALYVFDPTLHEEEKVGMPTKEFHEKLSRAIRSGDRDFVRNGMDIIWRGKTFIEIREDGQETQKHILGDIDYVRKSNFLILNIDPDDKPCGTYAEAFLAFERNIPIYLIQNMPLDDYNKSLMGWVLGSGGGIFPNQKQLLEFIDKKYKLKVRKEKKNV